MKGPAHQSEYCAKDTQWYSRSRPTWRRQAKADNCAQQTQQDHPCVQGGSQHTNLLGVHEANPPAPTALSTRISILFISIFSMAPAYCHYKESKNEDERQHRTHHQFCCERAACHANNSDHDIDQRSADHDTPPTIEGLSSAS